MSKIKSVLFGSFVGLAFCFAGCSSQNVTGAGECEQNSSKSAILYIYDDPMPVDSMSIPLDPPEWEIIRY